MIGSSRLEALLDEGARGAPWWGRLAGASLASLLGPLAALRARREVEVPRGLAAVAVGGALVGGAGRTPVAIACARHLAARGVPVALVGHAYRARPERARVVTQGTPRALAGDEALVAARVLAGTGARVVVAPTRAEAIALAAREARVVVLDGPLRVTGARRALSILAHPAEVPSRLAARLRARVDWVVGEQRGVLCLVRGGEVAPVTRLAGAAYGLALAIARPSRVARALEAHPPRVTLALGNHADLDAGALVRARALAEASGLDRWVATEKGPLVGVDALAGRPVWLLRHELALPDGLTRLLDALD